MRRVDSTVYGWKDKDIDIDRYESLISIAAESVIFFYTTRRAPPSNHSVSTTTTTTTTTTAPTRSTTDSRGGQPPFPDADFPGEGRTLGVRAGSESQSNTNTNK